jgi:hypothetical protein
MSDSPITKTNCSICNEEALVIVEDQNLWPSTKCWFCERDGTEKSSAVLIRMNKADAGEISLPIPKCVECDSVHTKIRQKAESLGCSTLVGAIVLFLGPILIFGWVFPDAAKEFFANLSILYFTGYGLLVYLVAVLFRSWYISKIRRELMSASNTKRSYGETDDFPKFKKLRELGWSPKVK